MAPRAAILLLSIACVREAAPLPPGELLDEMVFTRDSPLSRNAEIARRTLSPLTLRRGQDALAAHRQVLLDQPIDPSRERFALYLPAGAPPKDGYGLLVFVSPLAEPMRPQLWRPPLDRHRLIFVSAANSGNDAKVLDRRLPLALLAVENVRARYPVDPRRVYVGGLSGGSRVAEIAALAYPDVFRAALLDAGSEPIGGEAGLTLPPADLFRQFQQTKLLYVTGERDELNLHDDEVSRASMRAWCVLGVAVQVPRRLGHEPLDPASLERALTALDQSAAVDAGELERCNAGLEQERTARLAEVEAALARGDREAARALLKSIDAHFGGLAAAAILELDAKLAAL